MDKRSKYFFIFLSIAFALILALEIINGRFWLNDFKVYYGAAKAYLQGEQVYQRVFGEDTGLYKYSPVVLWFFAPITVLPYFWACIVHFALVAFCFVMVLRLAFRMSTEYYQLQNNHKLTVVFLTTLFTANHLFRELHLGNVNVILIGILLLAFHLQEREQNKFAGFLFAVAVFAKPYFLLLALPFVLSKNWAVLKSALVSALVMLALFTLGNGFSNTVAMHKEWIVGMQNHSEFLESFNTFSTLVKKYVSQSINGNIAAVALLLALVSTFVFSRKQTFAPVQKNETYVFFCALLAIIPCLVITDTEHFLFALPLITLLINLLLQRKQVVLTIIAFLALLFYSINLGDVVGDDFSVAAEHAGLLGIGTLLLVFLTLLIAAKQNKLQHPNNA